VQGAVKQTVKRVGRRNPVVSELCLQAPELPASPVNLAVASQHSTVVDWEPRFWEDEREG
jgi:hypothetical protein